MKVTSNIARVAIGVALGGGGHAAAAVLESGTTIHGCVSTRTHVLTIQKRCGSGSTALNWNQQGPAWSDRSYRSYRSYRGDRRDRRGTHRMGGNLARGDRYGGHCAENRERVIVERDFSGWWRSGAGERLRLGLHDRRACGAGCDRQRERRPERQQRNEGSSGAGSDLVHRRGRHAIRTVARHIGFDAGSKDAHKPGFGFCDSGQVLRRSGVGYESLS